MPVNIRVVVRTGAVGAFAPMVFEEIMFMHRNLHPLHWSKEEKTLSKLFLES